MEAIYLPSITGQFGNWRYYQLVASVKHLTEILGYNPKGEPIYRIKTVDEVEEIYSQKINEMLQRVFDESRLAPIKSYLLKQNDRYVNNLTIAIFGGDPEWLPIGLEGSSLEESVTADLEKVYKAFGIIKLSGQETLFVLDGQHRIKGLRSSILEDANLGDQEIALTLISHDPDNNGRERTRRLFTTINRYAKPVSLGESILLDEDDLACIIARKLIEDYEPFKRHAVVALNKGANLNATDTKKFTTTITLFKINESLIDKKQVYPVYTDEKDHIVIVRPEDGVIAQYYQTICKYWDQFFALFPNAKKFVEEPDPAIRNNGGPFSLRPVGQSIYKDFYQKAASSKTINLTDIKVVPDDLSNEFWHYVLWDPVSESITGTEAYARNYLYYHLGIPLSKQQEAALLKSYRKYHNDEKAKLPKRKFAKKVKALK